MWASGTLAKDRGRTHLPAVDLNVKKEKYSNFNTARSNEHVTRILVTSDSEVALLCRSGPGLLRRCILSKDLKCKIYVIIFGMDREHVMTFVGLCRKTTLASPIKHVLTINATLQRVFFFFPALTFQGLPYLGV